MNMKKKIFSGVLTLLVLGCFATAQPAAASSPTLSLSGTGDGDSVQVNVTGTANSSVILAYLKSEGLQTSYLGNTNTNGSFSTDISTAAYGISANSLVHVMVGGINGSQSADVAWPYSSAGNLALDKTSLVLALGQSATVTAYNNGTNLIYLSSNSNPIVANANINGNQISITAGNYGSTVVTVCAQASTVTCANTYISVQNTGSSPLAFSQNNMGLINGQSASVNIYGGTGSYLLTNNSNSNIISANVSGATVNLTANATSGFAAITICSSDLSACGIINANIGANNTKAISFNQASPTMSIGQNLVINISGGGSGTYSILSNSSTSIVGASISNSSLNLNALTGGSTTIIVCSSMGSCGSVITTVIGGNTSGGAIALSQNNLWLLVNQSFGLTVSGGTSPYNVLLGNSSIATATVNGSIVTITGVNAGSTTISVCSAAGGCANLSVLINGVSANATSTISLSPNQVFLNSISPATVNILGNGSYFISSDSNTNVATANISGSQVAITPINSGTATISVCQNGGQCANLLVTVNLVVSTPASTDNSANNSSTSDSNVTNNNSADNSASTIANNTLARSPEGKIYFIFNNAKEHITSLAELKNNYRGWKIQDVSDDALNQIPTKVSVFKFTGTIIFGTSGQAVTELQKKLKSLNLYNGSIDGRYSTAVVVAVRKYQKNNNLKQTGNVGPLTVNSLNK